MLKRIYWTIPLARIVATLSLMATPLVQADVIDASLIVRFDFDAAPVGNVIIDSSPAGGHPGTNSLTTWTAAVSSHQGVMLFDGAKTNRITWQQLPH